MNFKALFQGKKRDKTRQNLLVSVDDRQTQDHEVLSIKTTSTNNISLLINSGANLVNVHIDDLQDAIDRVRAFIEARNPQPQSQQPLGTQYLNSLAGVTQRAMDQEKALENGIKPIPDLTKQSDNDKVLVQAPLEEKELDLSS